MKRRLNKLGDDLALCSFDIAEVAGDSHEKGHVAAGIEAEELAEAEDNAAVAAALVRLVQHCAKSKRRHTLEVPKRHVPCLLCLL